MSEEVLKKVSNELNINYNGVKNVIKLLQEDCTIPFIARYRKEVTGNLNEDELRKIESLYKYNVNLEERKSSVIKLIDEKGMLTDEIKNAVNNATKLSEVEDIYVPFKEKKKTKGTEAIKLGLEPLAKLIMTFPNSGLEIADKFLTDKVKTREDAIINAGYIIADTISDNPKYRKWIKDYTVNKGYVVSKKKKDAKDDLRTYENYYDFKEKVNSIKSYRIFAIARAEKEKVVSYSIEADKDIILNYLERQIIKGKEFPLKSYVLSFIEDSYKRLIKPQVERSIKNDLFDAASSIGIEEFGNNLENLLLTPPIKERVVMGFDPAFRTGCKLAIVNKFGDLLDISVIYPHEPKKEVEEAKKIMLDLIKKYDVKIISIGNGTASRESEAFVSNLIKEYNLDVKYIIVSEAGASVYSASEVAKREFPDFSVEQRSAVSIARRLQDALSELVKIDPKSIGVGLYQHDLKQKELEEQLDFIVSKVVNKVGVNINSASEQILLRISGLDKKIVKAILSYRKKHGKINSRNELLNIKEMTDKSFEQSAGFLRILDGINPLDKTNIHPEDYLLVDKILNDYNIDKTLIGNQKMTDLISTINDDEVVKKYNITFEKLNMIKDNLINGIIDPRDSLEQVKLKSDILTIDDLEEGMEIDGVVRNVTSFGAFVDIGLHDDALIHISKISKDFIKHPSEFLKVGDIKTFYVCKIEKEKQRVSLSLIKE
ncbi:MAG: Tex-like N-terminal domain-containing protein [bacterium]|nr:Tex-like N-terminal domain-containing protein [bacterium]